jgi:hypothetical protein
MSASALLAVVLAAGPQTDASAVLRAWRGRADGAAVSTQVVVHEADAESAASAEPCALAWDPQGLRLAMRQGGLTVALAEGRLCGAHEAGSTAFERQIGGEALSAWREIFAEMPWPQPAMLLLPADRWPADMDPAAGTLVLERSETEGEDQVLRLKGEQGSWVLRFRGSPHARLVEAVRRIDRGPRVPQGAWIEWRMRFEHAEPESGIFTPPIEGRPRVGTLAAVMPVKAVAPPRPATRPGEHEVEATPEQRGDSIPPKP